MRFECGWELPAFATVEELRATDGAADEYRVSPLP